jgi:hypothetical protein
MTQTATKQLNETERPRRTLPFVHERDGRITSIALSRIWLATGCAADFGGRRRGCHDPAPAIHDRVYRNATYARGTKSIDAVSPAREQADLNESAVSNSNALGTKSWPLAISASRRSTQSWTANDYHARCTRAVQVRRRRSLTTFPAASTTRRRGTLPGPGGYDGVKVEMLVGVLFRRGLGRVR